MIYLTKKDNGITIFDIENLTKANLTSDYVNFFSINYDLSLNEKLRLNLNRRTYFWFMHDLHFLYEDNPQECNELNNVFENLYLELMNNRDIYEKDGLYGLNNKLIRTMSEINYPSDDESVGNATYLTIKKIEKGFILSFKKNVRDFQKTSWILKRNSSHYKKLANIYADGLLELMQLANADYDECQDKIEKEYVKKIKMYKNK